MTYYDSISEGYEELHGEEQLKKVALIKKHLKLKPTDKLLDVGCGTGLTTEPWNCKRYGVDPAKKLLEKARQKLSSKNEKGLEKAKPFQKDKIEYKLAPAEKIPYPDNSFDVVLSITAIQNFKDIEKGLKEIKRVGKNKFVLSFLKKSKKADKIKKLVNKYFKVEKAVEEDKDLMFFT
ncbi:methyltransferase domain-containing protein [Candidatus Woesearchaeota archaeon]|nr:methyltransferase domain-containing protein [Candidatus Woesearchaeota archaeon]